MKRRPTLAEMKQADEAYIQNYHGGYAGAEPITNPPMAQVPVQRMPAVEEPLPPEMPPQPRPVSDPVREYVMKMMNEKTDPTRYGIMSPEEMAKVKSERQSLSDKAAGNMEDTSLFNAMSAAADRMSTVAGKTPDSSGVRKAMTDGLMADQQKIKGFDDQLALGDKNNDRMMKADSATNERHSKAISLLNTLETARNNREMAHLKNEELKEYRNARLGLGHRNADIREGELKDKQVTDYGNRLAKAGAPEMHASLTRISALTGDGKTPGVGVTDSMFPTLYYDLQRDPKSQKAVQLRTEMAGLANSMLKIRSGTAVSDQEFRRVMEELAMGKNVTPQRFQYAMSRLSVVFEEQIRNLKAGTNPETVELYEGRGGSKFDLGKTKPKTIVQNGHTYTLNEQTGEYE